MSYNKKRIKQLETIVSTTEDADTHQYYKSVSQLSFPIRFLLQLLLIVSCAYVLVLFGGV